MWLMGTTNYSLGLYTQWKPAVNISFISNPEAVQADGMEGLILFKKRGKWFFFINAKLATNAVINERLKNVFFKFFRDVCGQQKKGKVQSIFSPFFL